ncbi:MAG: GNAT family N-acetyltransferase [Saprospiraceae bacterium]
MAIECKVVQGMPDNTFWEKFNVLWHNSADRSPFKSPHILQYFAGLVKGRLTAFQLWSNGDLRGTILLKEGKGVLSFLSDLKTDVNFFVLDRRCTANEENKFFEFFFSTIKQNNWSAILNNQPAWAHYMPALVEAGRTSGLFWTNLAYSVCPVLDAESPKALFERVQKAHKFRYYANRLAKMPEVSFEVFEDDTDLEAWTQAYCRAHIRRWKGTLTPSDFLDNKRRFFLLHCLQAWNQDGVLVRFSIKSPEGRIAFVIGLREANSLVFHATTFDPAYGKYSPGKALIHYIASWMSGKNLRILDFGDGNETYKYEVADQDRVLNRIFISRKNHLRFIAKTRFIQYIKDHPKIYHLYQNKLKPLVTRAAAAFHLPQLMELFFF